MSKISNNGEYVIHTEEKKEKGTTMFVTGVDSDLHIEIEGVSLFNNADFTEDDRWVVFIKPGDSLFCR